MFFYKPTQITRQRKSFNLPILTKLMQYITMIIQINIFLVFILFNMSSTVIQTRISQDDRTQAEIISNQLGLSLNDVFRMVVKSIIINRAIPVNLTLPSVERLPTKSEKLALDNYRDNSDLLGVEESAQFLDSLRGFLSENQNKSTDNISNDKVSNYVRN